MALKFQEPPIDKRTKWTSIFDALRARPQEWALVAESASHAASATHIRKGNYSGSEPGEFEARSFSNKNGTYDIYARYVGV